MWFTVFVGFSRTEFGSGHQGLQSHHSFSRRDDNTPYISFFFFLKTIAHHAFNGKSSNRSQFKGKVSIMFLASRMLAGKKKRFMKINFSGTPIQLSKIVRGTLTLI